MSADFLDDQFNAALDRVNKLGEETRLLRNRLEVWAATQPQTLACKRHAHVIRAIEWNESSRESYYATRKAGADTFKLIYTACEECAKDQAERDKGNWLKSCGVPEVVLHGSFATFRAESPEDRQNISETKRFVGKARGFLIMTGNLGDGKSLLAVAAMREFHGGLFITHNNLLMDLRRGYNHPKAVDIIERCQRAVILVVDDFGLSMGGSDELPMLQSIFDHRYGEKKPTVITSNLTLEGFYEAVGVRLADRMKQALFKHLQFTGQSSRPAERQSYFAEQ
jgi:DNA replication protein DnaC